MPFSQADLVKGKPYFILLYADEDLGIPVVQTLIFEEKRCLGGGDVLHFTEIKPRDGDSSFVVKSEHFDELVCDLAGLIDRLSKMKP